MIYVHVAYGDGTDKRVELGDVAELPTDNVAMIAVLTDEVNPATGKPHGRLQQAAYKDHFALCFREWDRVGWTMIVSWDDDEVRWVRHTRPWEPCSKIPVSPPLGVMHIVFHGGYVPENEWPGVLAEADRKLRLE